MMRKEKGYEKEAEPDDGEGGGGYVERCKGGGSFFLHSERTRSILIYDIYPTFRFSRRHFFFKSFHHFWLRLVAACCFGG